MCILQYGSWIFNASITEWKNLNKSHLKWGTPVSVPTNTASVGNSCVTSSDQLPLSMICVQSGAFYVWPTEPSSFLGCDNHEGTKRADSVKGPQQLRQSQCLFSPLQYLFQPFTSIFLAFLLLPLPELAPLDQNCHWQSAVHPHYIVISQESGAGPGEGPSWSHLRNGKSDGEAPTAGLRDQEETMGKLELFCTTLHKL